MKIRLATENDVETIAQLWYELVTYHQTLTDDMPKPAPDGVERYAQRIRYGLSDSYLKTFVAEIDEKIVGYVFGSVIDLLPETFVAENAGLIGDLYVQDAYRGMGVGSALMQAMKDWFKLRGVNHYEWYVAASNEIGVNFWQKTMHGKPIMMRMRASVDE